MKANKKRPNITESLLLHTLEHTILLLGEYQRRLAMFDKLSKIDKEAAQEKINQLATDSIRLLHTLDPALTYALEKFPEFKEFLTSCRDSIAKIKKSYNMPEKTCECRGCSCIQ